MKQMAEIIFFNRARQSLTMVISQHCGVYVLIQHFKKIKFSKFEFLKNQIWKNSNFENQILNFMFSLEKFGDRHLSQFGIEEIYPKWIFFNFLNRDYNV